MTFRTASLCLLFFSWLSCPLWGENIRGNVTDIVDLSIESGTSQEYNLKVNELLGVFPGSKSDFLQGIEISVKIPAPLIQSGTSFLLFVYKKVAPEIREGLANYRAMEAGHLILPARSRIYLEIPLDGGLPGNAGSAPALSMETPIAVSDLPLMITVLPMSKGAPQSLDTEAFQIKISPQWGEIGKVEIVASGEPIDQSSLMLWIDDEKINFSGQPLLLPAGVHTLLAQADGCREITRSFAVQKAQTIRLELPFEHLISSVLFEAPADTLIYLDGDKIAFPQNSPLNISDGEHTVLFMLGDYRISKHFRIVPGKDYKISLFLDILMQEY